MKIFFRCAFAVLVLSLLAPAHSFALQIEPQQVPEIDPSLAAGSIALIAGAVAVIRGKRKRS